MTEQTTPSMDTDVIDPATEDWTTKATSAVYWAAKDGIQQAKDELARRERESAPEIPADQ